MVFDKAYQLFTTVYNMQAEINQHAFSQINELQHMAFTSQTITANQLNHVSDNMNKVAQFSQSIAEATKQALASQSSDVAILGGQLQGVRDAIQKIISQVIVLAKNSDVSKNVLDNKIAISSNTLGIKT